MLETIYSINEINNAPTKQRIEYWRVSPLFLISLAKELLTKYESEERTEKVMGKLISSEGNMSFRMRFTRYMSEYVELY